MRATDRERSRLTPGSEAVVVVDADGLITSLNAPAEALFGYGCGELVGRPVEVLVPEEGRGMHERRRAECRAPHGRGLGTGTWFAARRKDGTSFAADIALHPLRDGRRTWTAAVVRPVEALRPAPHAGAWLRSLTAASHDGVVGTTVDGTIVVWGGGAAGLYGYDADDMVGGSVAALWPAGEQLDAAGVLGRVAQGERVLPYQTEHVRSDGTLVPVLLSHSPVRDAAGTVVGVLTVHRDETERVRAESMFRGLLEAAPDAMVCVDGAGRIAFVNAQTERLFGYARSELVGAPVEMLVPEAERAAHARSRATYLEDPRPRMMGSGRQLRARRKDGTEFPADISLSGTLETERGTLVTAAIRNATDRLEAETERDRLRMVAAQERFEAQMHRARRLESLGQLAGGVAHDFNNLLGIILNYTAFVAEEVAKAADHDPRWDDVAEDLEQTRRAAQRGAELTRQLLAVGRREVVRPEVVDLNDVVRGVEPLLRRAVGEAVDVLTSLDPVLPDVLADPGQLEQVLVNLAVNARDAMPTGGALSIDTDAVDVDMGDALARPGVKPGRYARLRVSDTGVGMDREVQDRAFEPFFTTKAAGIGTGLGLATVYGIISQAGGDTRIYSEPGIGTTVSVLLPVTALGPVLCPVGGDPDAGVARGETVLVVEDEAAMRDLTVRILLRHGYRVIAAGGGTDALTAAAEHHGAIDLLLTDVVMPHMLGKELAQRIVIDRPSTRVLFMSGYAQPVLASQGTLDEGVALLGKPFTRSVLLSKVREVLDA